MQEKDIIKNLKELKKIEPNQNWVFSAKQEILGVDKPQENRVKSLEWIKFLMGNKLAYATLTVLVLLGLAGFAQNSLPGDRLYRVKRTTEQLQTALKNEEPIKTSFDFVNRRLEELDTAVTRSYERNINPAVEEFQASISSISENVNIEEVENVEAVKKEIDEIDQKASNIEALGVKLDREELDNLKERTICREVKDLLTFQETRTLSEREGEILTEAKEFFEEGQCQEAKDKILVDLQNQENEFEITNNEDE